MVELSKDQLWVKKARELLNKARREALENEVKGLQDGLAPVLEKLWQEHERLRKSLADISREISAWKGGQPHGLETQIGAVGFEAERYLNGLKGLSATTPEDKRACADLLIKVRAALKAMQKKETEACELREEDRAPLNAEAEERRHYQEETDKVIVTQQTAINKERKALETYAKETKIVDFKDDPFAENIASFYKRRVPELEELTKGKKAKPLNKDEAAQLKFGKQVVAVNAEKALKAKAVESAEQSLLSLKKERAQGLAPLEVALEKAKLVQEISWETLADIRYGTPLDATQLNATLSAHSGSIVYEASEKLIESGKTLLPAGRGQVLRASVVGDDRSVYRQTADKEVKINVLKAAVTLTCAASTEYVYGTAFGMGLLSASVSTAPPLPGDHVKLLAVLNCTTKGNALPAGEVLGAGTHALTVSSAAKDNFLASNEVSVALTVNKAPRVLAAGSPEPIGAIVQANDLKQLRIKFSFTTGEGTNQFFIGTTLLAVGAKVSVAKKSKLRVEALPHDNYLPVEREVEVEVLSADAKFALARKGGDDLLVNKPMVRDKLHSTQEQVLSALLQEIVTLAKTDDEQKFVKTNELIEEVEEIKAKLVSWKGTVPKAAPKGARSLLQVDIIEAKNDTLESKKQKTVSATTSAVKKLVKHGGMTLADVEKLVPSGLTSNFVETNNYKGFKFEWTTPSGVKIEIYGHGPTTANLPDNTVDSKRGNLVRVMIDGKFLKPDGNLTDNRFDASSHMALY